MGFLKKLLGQPSNGEDGQAWQDAAHQLGEDGRRALDDGDVDGAVASLLEALKLHEAHDDESGALLVSQFLGSALYRQGREDEAILVWEEIIRRGYQERHVFEWLISHYEENSRGEDAERVRGLLESLEGS